MEPSERNTVALNACMPQYTGNLLSSEELHSGRVRKAEFDKASPYFTQAQCYDWGEGYRTTEK
jgi:hypothetical protein